MDLVIMMGRVGRKPELRTAGNGGMKYSFLNIAISKPKKEVDGKWGEKTDWLSIKVFNQQADYCCTYLEAGDLISIEGQHTTHTQEIDGKKITKTDIIGNRIKRVTKGKVSLEKSKPVEPMQVPKATPSYQPPSQETQFSVDDIPF